MTCAKNHGDCISLNHKPCEDCGLRNSTFGMRDEEKKTVKPRWCGPCGKAHPGAVEVHRIMCEDCSTKHASFGVPPNKKKRWCSKCAKSHRGSMSLRDKVRHTAPVRVTL